MQLNNPDLLKTKSFINHQWVNSQHYFNVENPADQQTITKVCEVTDEQLELAVCSASEALQNWQSLELAERVSQLEKWYQLIIENLDDLATIMTTEQGKVLKESKSELVYGAKYIQWYAQQANRVNGEILAGKQGKKSLVLKKPVGLVAAITPWNFPSAMILRKAAAALAAGCSFIVKPSELTPLSALALAELSLQADLPRGVFNVVVGSDAQRIGKVLTQHPKIAKFSFTGSTAVGKKLLAQCATTVKKTSMELGGNAPCIVFEDARLDLAVKGIIASKFRNSGQTCVSSNRIFIQQNIADKFIDMLTEKIKQLVTGAGHLAKTDLGPLIENKAIRKISKLIEQAVDTGAKVVCGGKPLAGAGNFYPPTMLTNIDPGMDIFNCEVFGPVLPITLFENEDQVIQLANQTEYGLAAYAFTEDLRRIWRLTEQLQFGMIGINEGAISDPAAPFGGIKQSGMGREGGHWGIEEYLETRYVCIGNLE